MWKGTVTFNIVNFVDILTFSTKRRLFIRKAWNRLLDRLCTTKTGRGVVMAVTTMQTKCGWRTGRENTTKHWHSSTISILKTILFSFVLVFHIPTPCCVIGSILFNLQRYLLLDSRQLRVKYLGATPLRKIIAMMHISTPTEKPKRAIVLLGRQHAGETPSSYLIQNIVDELLGPNP